MEHIFSRLYTTVSSWSDADSFFFDLKLSIADQFNVEEKEDLPYWEDAGEFYVPIEKIDLINIPKSHSWWTDAYRSADKN